MQDCRFDITYHDFNPSVLFVSRKKMLQNSRYHEHDFTEITYILSGKGQYLIQGTTYPVQAGDLIICNIGVSHQNVVLDEKEPTTEFFVGFTDFHLKNLPANTLPLKDNAYILHTGFELRQNLTSLCHAMLAENESGQVGKYFMLKSYLIQFLLMLIRETSAPQPVQDGYHFENHYKSYAVNQITAYLDMHYNEKISLDRIAQNMYLSPVYISKIFKEETGESPINYLIKRRLEKAKSLLKQPNPESIKQIAIDVGYEDAYHFSKLFKKYFGISPLHYRRQGMKEGQQP
jgi:AraC-like DNA-binding protein